MNNLDDILNFCVNLSREMIISGANLERVHLAVQIICKAYELNDVSIFLLSNYISVGAYDKEGNYSSRQASVPSSGIHLEKLRSLNQLSYKIAEITPNPKTLSQMLERALNVKSYPDWVILLGKICAVFCLCMMFGGSVNELIPIAASVAVIHYFMRILDKSGLDKILANALTMFASVCVGALFIYSHFGDNLPAVIIGISLLVIPGIPLVNSMRNLFCGRENNGILQMIKIFIETMALGMGAYSALVVLSHYVVVNAPKIPTLNPYLMVLLSFIASVSFGVVFEILPKDLWLAGLGGVLSRIALLLLTPVISRRLLFMTLSAFAASLYAESLAVKRRQPSTYYLYPSIIPLIPGDLFFFVLAGIQLGNSELVRENGINCLLSLSGLSIGFVLSSTFTHYARKLRYA